MSTRSMRSSIPDLLIVGGGAAGMMAAVTAARRGASVVVLEPNRMTGRKLRITGKGRCNVTNDCEVPEFLKNVRTNARFLKSALYAFPPSTVKSFFEEAGVPLKTERGNRVFPVSDKADDIADALEREAMSLGVRRKKEKALSLLTENGEVRGVLTSEGERYARSVLLATGGISYPATGSTGDGYAMAESVGHTIVPLRASLVSIEAEEDCAEMQGLSLRNVTLSLYRGDKLLYRELGEMLFTHFGVSGPLVLSASAFIEGDAREYRMSVDLKPGLSEEKLDERLLRDFAENKNRDFGNALSALLPQKLIGVVIRRSGIDAHTKVNTVTRAQRLSLLRVLKNFDIRLIALRSAEEAIITAGGVDTAEVNARTMESKLCRGLYFAGEILDTDACTGGFNLQIAWSTAHAVGSAIPIEKENTEE